MSVQEHWIERAEREAAERLEAELNKPMPAYDGEVGMEGFFDPWGIFPIYGSYSSEFDECAIAVLSELQRNVKERDDLGAEMFREMLCKLELCSYGSSPRVCFPTSRVRALLPRWIDQWKTYSALQWH